jgi:hypothetical protein
MRTSASSRLAIAAWLIANTPRHGCGRVVDGCGRNDLGDQGYALLAGWETGKIVRRYAHLAAEHLAVYASNTESHGTNTAQAPDSHGGSGALTEQGLVDAYLCCRQASAASHCFFSDQRLHQPGTNLNWRLQTQCTNSKPARVTAAVL